MSSKWYYAKQKIGGTMMWLHIAYPTKKAALEMLPTIVRAEPDGMQIALIKVCNQFVVVDGKSIVNKEG